MLIAFTNSIRMEKNYTIKQKIVRFGKAIGLCIGLSMPGYSLAQLTGTYTLNNTLATSGTNFNNWTDFSNSLNLMVFPER